MHRATAGDINPARLKFGIRGGCRVTEISTGVGRRTRRASERASELSKSCHRAARILSSTPRPFPSLLSPSLTLFLSRLLSFRVQYPSRSLSLSAASSYAGSAQTRRYRPPVEARPCVSGRVSLPCSRAGAVTATAAAAVTARVPHAS